MVFLYLKEKSHCLVGRFIYLLVLVRNAYFADNMEWMVMATDFIRVVKREA